MKEEEGKMYELAVSQFIGFTHCKNGYSISQLVESMGLTVKEWNKIKRSEALIKDEIIEIDNYFNKQS